MRERGSACLPHPLRKRAHERKGKKIRVNRKGKKICFFIKCPFICRGGSYSLLKRVKRACSLLGNKGIHTMLMWDAAAVTVKYFFLASVK